MCWWVLMFPFWLNICIKIWNLLLTKTAKWTNHQFIWSSSLMSMENLSTLRLPKKWAKSWVSSKLPENFGNRRKSPWNNPSCLWQSSAKIRNCATNLLLSWTTSDRKSMLKTSDSSNKLKSMLNLKLNPISLCLDQHSKATKPSKKSKKKLLN